MPSRAAHLTPLPAGVLLVLPGLLALLAACAAPTPSPSPSAFASLPATPQASASAPASTSPAATPAGSIAGSTNPPLPTGPERLAVERFADGLQAPIGIVAAGDGTGRLFALEQAGRVRVIAADGTLAPQPFVDLTDRILSGGERGLLGLAFHPAFADNGRLFVHYSRAGDGATVLAELRANAARTSADPTSERVLLTQIQPYANHNGGAIVFGPDGYLYLGLGDGGSGGDPLGNAQNTGVLLGKILRLDVDGRPAGGKAYAIPVDNPFAANGVQPGQGAPEVWAYGLRNPWQLSFDPRTGDLYVGDVGQGSWEEIDRQPSDSPGGENYGWGIMEGRHCYVDGCDQAGYVKPIAEYSHELGCSVTGGQVYRGTAQPDLVGIYVFGDYCSGRIFTLHVDEGTVTPKVVAESGLGITALGTGEDGEIYLADVRGGTIYRVVVDD